MKSTAKQWREVAQRLDSLFDAVRDARSVLILPHNDPDPDAIASAVALRYLLAQGLGAEAWIAYKGIIGRAENKALVQYLGNPLRRLSRSDLQQSVPIALVDTQAGAGNNALPAETIAAIAIDHHPLREMTALAKFADVRPELGATSTILTGYLQAAEFEPSPQLATALFYGIATDTMGLARGASPADVAAYFYLQTRIDVDALVEIEQAQVPPDYFQRLHEALNGARIYDGVVISYVGLMSRPDLAGEMADLLLRLQGARWVICTGVYKDALVLAIRNRSRRGGAGQLAQDIVGGRGTAGGHGTMAGGLIPLQSEPAEQVVQQLERRALDYLKLAPEPVGKPLIPRT
jgi:nanoRNase/pAp phosphatase (c-di-AMP/oligoRNAs hydrolase)